LGGDQRIEHRQIVVEAYGMYSQPHIHTDVGGNLDDLRAHPHAIFEAVSKVKEGVIQNRVFLKWDPTTKSEVMEGGSTRLIRNSGHLL